MPVDTASLQIVNYPDPVLRRKAAELDAVTDEVREVAARMIELMHEAGGVGLAAPQVGLSWRMFVANDTGEPGNDRVFINPILHNPGRQTEVREEGCLSIPNVTAEVTRPGSITIQAVDEKGQQVLLTAEGLPARIWQHETDHLDGVLIIDRMTPADKMANRRALRELEEGA